MKVYTYYSNVGSMNAFEQARMIALWKASWSRHGWEPIVLTPADARANPMHDQLVAKFATFPTVNNKEYEMACWLRWIAMAMVGGTMTDYDVLAFGFTPADIPTNDGEFVSILADNNPCPCAVSGTAQQYENTVRAFAEMMPGDSAVHGDRPHFSDQSAVQAMSARLRPHIHDLCPEYRSRHWQSAGLVHYSHGCTDGHDRVALMRQGLEGVRE